MRCTAKLTLLLTPLMVLTPFLNQPLVAQQHPRSDSTPCECDSRSRTNGAHLLLLVMPAFVAVMAAAPSAVLLSSHFTDPDTTGILAKSYLTAYVAEGGMTQQGSKVQGDTHSETVEFLAGHFYGAFRSENFKAPDRVQFETVRAGYLLRAKRVLAGGLTLGYRYSSGHDVQDAVEIGLPLIMGDERAGIRLEPSYLISSEGIAWNYRGQAELYMAKPLVLGIAIEVKPLRQGAAHFTVISLLAGLRRQSRALPGSSRHP